MEFEREPAMQHLVQQPAAAAAVETGGFAVLWVFQDYDAHWRVRREGERADVAFPSRERAVAAARAVGASLGAYRLYLQLRNGRFTIELLNLRAGRTSEARAEADGLSLTAVVEALRESETSHGQRHPL